MEEAGSIPFTWPIVRLLPEWNNVFFTPFPRPESGSRKQSPLMVAKALNWPAVSSRSLAQMPYYSRGFGSIRAAIGGAANKTGGDAGASPP
jgi:hypothetical protein